MSPVTTRRWNEPSNCLIRDDEEPIHELTISSLDWPILCPFSIPKGNATTGTTITHANWEAMTKKSFQFGEYLKEFANHGRIKVSPKGQVVHLLLYLLYIVLVRPMMYGEEYVFRTFVTFEWGASHRKLRTQHAGNVKLGYKFVCSCPPIPPLVFVILKISVVAVSCYLTTYQNISFLSQLDRDITDEEKLSFVSENWL